MNSFIEHKLIEKWMKNQGKKISKHNNSMQQSFAVDG